MDISKIGLWFRIIRPQTLFASVCPVVVALALTAASTPVGIGIELNKTIAVCTVFCALALQVLSNLINDYYDFLRGTDKKGRVGFKRALAEGEVSARQMRAACLLTALIAVLLGICLVLAGGWRILLIGVTALLFAWLYTATRHSLSYLGIADIFVFLYYGVVAGWGTAWLQCAANGLTVGWQALLPVVYATAVNGLISMFVLMINNLRDMEDDRAAGKRTLPVRFGKRTAETLLALFVILAVLFAWLATRDWVVCLVLLPVSCLYGQTLRAEGAAYNRCLLLAGLTNLAYTLLIVCRLALV